MDISSLSPKKSNFFMKLLNTLDSFYTKFLGSLLLLSFATNVIKKFFLKLDGISSVGTYLLIIVPILIAIFWTRLSDKVNLSLFERPLPSNQKKSALFSRGFWIFMCYTFRNTLSESSRFQSGIGKFLGSIMQLLFTFGLIILSISMIAIFLRPAFRNRYISKGKRSTPKESAEIKIRKAGEQGEKEVEYALSWLDDQYKVFNNVYLEYNGQVQEFDHLVVGENGVFNIETKNLAGNIIIDNDGNWIREKDGQREGMKNPLFQVKRHNKILSGVLRHNYPIIDIVTLANEKTIITGSSNSPIHVIKSDMLQHFIEEYSQSNPLSQEDIKIIMDSIEKCSKNRGLKSKGKGA